MSGVNRVFILGNLGRDPETNYTQAGAAITKIAVATSETWNDKNTGEKREKTEWHRITFFGKQAETISRYMTKGSQIYVEGRLQTSEYEKDGIKRYSTDIIANNFQFIGSKNDNQQQSQQQGNYNQNNQQPNTGGFQAPNNSQQQQSGGFVNNQQTGFQSQQQGPPDDDIPF